VAWLTVRTTSWSRMQPRARVLTARLSSSLALDLGYARRACVRAPGGGLGCKDEGGAGGSRCWFE
jgi:hypothetical protein